MLTTATLGIAVISLLLSAGTQAQQNTNDIVETDIQASNGVIHVIDTVIIPDSKK